MAEQPYPAATMAYALAMLAYLMPVTTQHLRFDPIVAALPVLFAADRSLPLLRWSNPFEAARSFDFRVPVFAKDLFWASRRSLVVYDNL